MSTLSEMAILAQFSAKAGVISKRDKASTAEFTQDHNASEDSAAVMAKLFPASACGKDNAIVKARQWITACRTWHYEHTLEYETGWQLLPLTGVEAHERFFAGAKAELAQRTAAVRSDYDGLVALAQTARNGLFRREDYPTANEFASGFEIVVNYKDVPNGGALPSRLAEARFAAIRKGIEEENERRLAQAAAEQWRRLLEPVVELAGRLADPGRRRLSGIIEQVKRIATLAPEINLTQDAGMEAAGQEIMAALNNVEVDALNENALVRTELAAGLVTIAQRYGVMGHRNLG